jgi:hypothetical protein
MQVKNKITSSSFNKVINKNIFFQEMILMTVGSKVKQTLATLKGVESTLRVYSVKSQNVEEREVFEEALEVTGEVIHDLKIRVNKLEYEEPQYKGF